MVACLRLNFWLKLFQEQGIKFRVLIQTERDLNRQVVKSDYATITVPEIELEIPHDSQKGGNTIIHEAQAASAPLF